MNNLNSQFIYNPIRFAETHTLDLLKLDYDLLESYPGCKAFDILNAQKDGLVIPDEVYLKPVPLDYKYDNDTPLHAYYLPYISMNSQDAYAPYIDIPRYKPDKKFLFTGTLSSCSIVLKDIGNDMLRVFHDSRMNSSCFYDNIVAKIDFDDYKNYEINNGMASMFMHFDRYQGWLLYSQKQVLFNTDSVRKYSGEEQLFIIR